MEIGKRNVTAATKAVLEDGAALVLCGVAAGGCKTQCAGCDENKWAAEATEEVADRGRHLRAEEVAQRRSSPIKKEFIHPLIHSYVHSFVLSLIHTSAHWLFH